MGEVEHGPDPAEPARDLDDVVRRAQLADAPHHFDPEWNSAILRLEPLAQLAELLDDRVDRLLARPAEEEARVEDDDLGARGLGDPRRVVQHADGHVQLLAALGVAHEAGDRRVHRQSDVGRRATLAEVGGEVVVHPEASLEVDLAGRQPPFEERVHRRCGRVARRHPRRPVMESARHECRLSPGSASPLHAAELPPMLRASPAVRRRAPERPARTPSARSRSVDHQPEATTATPASATATPQR